MLDGSVIMTRGPSRFLSRVRLNLFECDGKALTVGLYASFRIAIIMAIAGDRPAMISARIGAMALVMATSVKEHGIDERREVRTYHIRPNPLRYG
jgi:hypothetical protein